LFTRLTPTGVVVASRSHCQTIWGAGQQGIAVPAEPLKKLDVSWSGIRAGDIVAKPLPNIGSMVGECGPL
jgi:hypothetical protein